MSTTRQSLSQAVNETLRAEMQRDPNVVLLGEDVGQLGGVFGATRGLLEEFGATRVFDLEYGEEASLATALGMAHFGLRPVVDIQFSDFAYPSFDPILNEIATSRYRSGGQFPCPIVIRMPYGGGIGGGPSHSLSPESHFVHAPGLTVVAPSDAASASGLLRAAIRSDDPVVFLEPVSLYHEPTLEVPDSDTLTGEIGRAVVLREGRHVTVPAYGAMVGLVAEAAEALAADGIETEILDLRTLAPLDEATILASVEKTGRLVAVHEAPRTGGLGAELAALVAERAILHLEAPVLRVTGYDTPVPYALEAVHRPDVERIERAIREAVGF